MAISKRTRFEIFARDGFICQYCGNKPPDVILEVDHIDPRSNGGSDEDLNLVTSCFTCNRGKGAKILKEMAARPDADLKYLHAAQELAEAERFLETKRLLDAVRGNLVASIQSHWYRRLATSEDVPADSVIHQWLSFYTPEQIIDAIDRSVPAIHGRPWTFKRFDNYVRYVSGVLRNQKEQREYRLA